MVKYVIGVIVIILIAISGYYAWQYGVAVPAPEPLPQEPAKSTYATSTFAITHPVSYSVDDTYAYEQFEGKPIRGVKFTIPASMTEGTNLSTDTYLSVEWLPRARNCTGDIYIPANVKAFELTAGTTTYSAATTTGAAAGNIYEEQVFAIKGSKPCTAVRYYIHSGDIMNYPQEGEDAVKEFDRDALIRVFDEIRNSLMLEQ